MKFIYKFNAMSTPCEISIYDIHKNKADSIAESVVKEVKRLEKKYNYYNTNSYLSMINNRKEHKLDQESKSLLMRAKQYYKLTDGVFDITVATIKDLYKSELSLDALNKKREKYLPFVGCEHFDIKKDKIIFDNEFTKIDLGGFVKEYAVDRSVNIIKKAKVKSALVNYGGDIYAIGKKPNNEYFKIGIKNPNNPKENIEYVMIQNQALTTSASYERNYKIDQEELSHILSKDKLSFTPQSVTVVSSNCVESGVYSTALMINPQMQHNHKAIIINNLE